MAAPIEAQINGVDNLLYMTSHTYNPEDELRIAYDDPEIVFDWLKLDIR